MTDGVTEKDSKSLLLDSGLSTKVVECKCATMLTLKCDDVVSFGELSLVNLRFQEKLLKISYRYLYRKPPQVVKERILR